MGFVPVDGDAPTPAARVPVGRDALPFRRRNPERRPDFPKCGPRILRSPHQLIGSHETLTLREPRAPLPSGKLEAARIFPCESRL